MHIILIKYISSVALQFLQSNIVVQIITVRIQQVGT